jgi:hypothetical protein
LCEKTPGIYTVALSGILHIGYCLTAMRWFDASTIWNRYTDEQQFALSRYADFWYLSPMLENPATTSYCVFSTGICMVALAVTYLVFDTDHFPEAATTIGTVSLFIDWGGF